MGTRPSTSQNVLANALSSGTGDYQAYQQAQHMLAAVGDPNVDLADISSMNTAEKKSIHRKTGVTFPEINQRPELTGQSHSRDQPLRVSSMDVSGPTDRTFRTAPPPTQLSTLHEPTSTGL